MRRSTSSLNRIQLLFILMVLGILYQHQPNLSSWSIRISDYRTSATQGSKTKEAAAATITNTLAPSSSPTVRELTSEDRVSRVCTNASSVWHNLCKGQFVSRMDQLLYSVNDGASKVNNQNRAAILQIGAHTGWTENDPLVNGMTSYSQEISREARSRVSFVYVEASPPTFARLEKNLEENSDRFNLTALHMGVLPDDSQAMNLTFYSMSESIDRETGLDSRSGKSFPNWISQISSFRKELLLKHQDFLRKKRIGLDIRDYIVEEQIKTIRFSTLLDQVQPLLVLIDTEGLDCQILRATNNLTTPFIIFENMHCGKRNLKLTHQHLASFGYQCGMAADYFNTFCYITNVTG